jgi:transposase
MIASPGNVRVWLATGHTDMRRGFRIVSAARQGDLADRFAQ